MQKHNMGVKPWKIVRLERLSAKVIAEWCGIRNKEWVEVGK